MFPSLAISYRFVCVTTFGSRSQWHAVLARIKSRIRTNKQSGVHQRPVANAPIERRVSHRYSSQQQLTSTQHTRRLERPTETQRLTRRRSTYATYAARLAQQNHLTSGRVSLTSDLSASELSAAPTQTPPQHTKETHARVWCASVSVS